MCSHIGPTMENLYPRGLKHRTGPISLPSDMHLSQFRWSLGYCTSLSIELHEFRRNMINFWFEDSLITGTSASQQEGLLLACGSCYWNPQSQPWRRRRRTSPWTPVFRLSLWCSKVPGEVQVQFHGLHIGGAGKTRQTASICSG